MVHGDVPLKKWHMPRKMLNSKPPFAAPFSNFPSFFFHLHLTKGVAYNQQAKSSRANPLQSYQLALQPEASHVM